MMREVAAMYVHLGSASATSFFYSSLIALILHSQVLLPYKLFSYLIHHINLEWH